MSASHGGTHVRWWLGLLGAVTLSVAATAPALADVTGAADNLRTAWYPDEPSLAPAQLSTERFKQAFDDTLKGQVYAQPLVASGTVLVVTEENWAYGLDPVTGAVRWEKELGQLAHVGTAVESGSATSEATIKCPDIEPRVGVTGTPVIDTEREVAYLVANSYEAGSSGPVAWYVHALALGSGEEVAGFPVKISGKATNLPSVTFEALQQLQRPALLLVSGVVYAGFGSHCDTEPFEGWIVGVSTSKAEVVTKWAVAEEGASIWQSGGGLLSDAPGQILFSTGNGGGEAGAFDPPIGPGTQTEPSPEGHLGESVVRVEVGEGGELKTKDYFSPFNSKELDEADLDIGSWGLVELPSLPSSFGTPSIPHLLVQEGKQGTLYLLNRDALGGHEKAANNIVQEIAGVSPFGVWGTAAVWPGEGGYVIAPSAGAHMKSFKYEDEEDKGEPHLNNKPILTSEEMKFGSGSPIVTSDGVSAGTAAAWIIWCPNTANGCKEGELRAYRPATAQLRWHGDIGFASKFSRPGVSDGHIYVGNRAGHLIAFSGPALKPSRDTLELAAPLGETASGEITFENTGSELEIKAVTPPDAPFEVLGLPAKGTRLAPGQVIKARVIFRPSVLGRASGTLDVLTLAGEIKTALTGVGEESAKERADREARERVEHAAGTFFGPGPGAETSAAEPVLTNLKIRSRGSHLGARPRTLVITYRLSSAAPVRLIVYRRSVTPHCRHHVRTCVHWKATSIRETIAGRTGANARAIDLRMLPAGSYRLAATPVTGTAMTPATRYLYFSTSH